MAALTSISYTASAVPQLTTLPSRGWRAGLMAAQRTRGQPRRAQQGAGGAAVRPDREVVDAAMCPQVLVLFQWVESDTGGLAEYANPSLCVPLKPRPNQALSRSQALALEQVRVRPAGGEPGRHTRRGRPATL